MSNAVLIAIGCLVLIDIILFLAFRITAEKLDLARLKNDEYEYTIKALKKENSALRESMKLIAENERKANEKIEALHTGDTVANAISGLSKHASYNG